MNILLTTLNCYKGGRKENETNSRMCIQIQTVLQKNTSNIKLTLRVVLVMPLVEELGEIVRSKPTIQICNLYSSHCTMYRSRQGRRKGWSPPQQA